MAIYFLIPSFQNLPIIREFKGANELDRWYMTRNSIRLFFEHPITGIGLGNWVLEAYKYGVKEFSDFNNPTRFIRYGNHNLYSQILAELGLIGFISFIVGVGTLVVKASSKLYLLSALQKASLCSLLVYLITSLSLIHI